jgi:transcription initiation factor IIE alpha subunit
LTNAYRLLRTGKLCSLALRYHGPIAGKVVEELSSRGFSSCWDLITAVRDAMVDDGEDEPGEEQLANVTAQVVNAIERLAEDNFFARAQIAQSHIMYDARQDAEEHLVNNPPDVDPKLKGRKALEQHLSFIDIEMQQRIDSRLSTSILKTALEGATMLIGEKAIRSSADLHICVNYSRVVKAVRDGELFQHVDKTLGGRHGKIMRAILKEIDLSGASGNPTVSHEPSGVQIFSVSRLGEHLEDSEMELHGSEPPHTNGWHKPVEMTNGTGKTNGYPGHEDILQSLRRIAEGSYTFLTEGKDGAWSVDAGRLRNFLLRSEILKIARQQVGPAGLRLLRILIDKGRLDERVLQEVGLLAAKELRQTLGILHTMGFTDLQEVPRDPQRLPNRTTFLWFYDEARVQKSLLDGIYKSQARVYERMRDERDAVRTTLEKVERYHCEGHEDEYMSKAEATLLQQYRRKEMWLLGEIARLDDSVALLRDV